MQLTTNVSKSIILAVLSCSFFLAFYDHTLFDLNLINAGFNSTSLYDVSMNDANTTRVGNPNANTVTAPLPVKSANESANAKQVDTIWDSMSPELKLDHQVQLAQVQKEIRKLLADKEKLYSILKAAGPYIYFIREQTRARGLPAELALIPVIESEFNPNDHSNKGATGLWQIMPQTARELGIKIKSSYDGRRSVVASTKAALAYFKDLGTMFGGNWYLAIAAYNCGQMKVFSAQRHAGSKSFWNLKLPQETKLYVPKLLAVAEIVKHPEKYGVALPPITNEPYFAEVKVKKPVKLETVAQNSGVSMDTLHKLNPDYNHPVVPTKGAYSILVPASTATVVRTRLADRVVLS